MCRRTDEDVSGACQLRFLNSAKISHRRGGPVCPPVFIHRNKIQQRVVEIADPYAVILSDSEESEKR